MSLMTSSSAEGSSIVSPLSSLPLVSIVVPVFNGERYLRQSLDSLMAQSYPRCEVLLMDDASTDGTSAIVASYGNRVTSVRQPENVGQFANVNDGIARARGEYIAVFHADDLYHPTIVEQEVTYLNRHRDAGAVFTLYVFIDEAGNEYGRLTIPKEVASDRPLPYVCILNALLEYKNRFLCGPSSMVRASVYREIGLYRGHRYGIASDLDMWVRIAQKHSIGIIREHLMSYRHGHGNSTQRHYHLRTRPEGHFAILDECLAHGPRVPVRAEALAAHEAHRAEDQIMLAINHYILGDLKSATILLGRIRQGVLLRSRRVHRFRLVLLHVGLSILVRLPRIPPLANACYRRWHVKTPPTREACWNGVSFGWPF